MSDQAINLTIRNLKGYYRIGPDQDVKAVDNISFSARPGEILGVAGESGCGKSTLLKICTAWIKPPLKVVEGKVLYTHRGKEIDLYACKPAQINKLRWSVFTLVPQAAMNSLNPVRKIGKIFEETIFAHQPKEKVDQELKRESRARIREAIGEIGLPKEILTMYPCQLSGGMKQRVALSLGLITRPSVVFCDEPTSGLDLVTQKGILQFLRNYTQAHKITVMFINHDMGVHAQLSDTLLITYAGKQVELAPTQELFAHPLHPYSKALIGSLPVVGDRHKRLGLPGSPPSLIDPPAGCRFHPRCEHAMEICKKEEPEYKEVSPGHYVACYLQGGA